MPRRGLERPAGVREAGCQDWMLEGATATLRAVRETVVRRAVGERVTMTAAVMKEARMAARGGGTAAAG
jgi:hypothetical protein